MARRLQERVNDLPRLEAVNIDAWAEQVAGLSDSDLRELARYLVRFDGRFEQIELAVFHLSDLISNSTSEMRMLAAFILQELAKEEWNDAFSPMAVAIASDPNWGVREGAQLLLKTCLLYHFDEVIPLVERWASDDDPNVRRAALLACRPTPRLSTDTVTRRLEVVELLLEDDDPYVMKNVPYALSFFRHYPDLLFPHLHEWVEEGGPRTRRNVALTCDSTLANTHPQEVMQVLHRLIDDERHMVRRALVRAVRAVGHKHIDIAKGSIELWGTEGCDTSLLRELDNLTEVSY